MLLLKIPDLSVQCDYILKSVLFCNNNNTVSSLTTISFVFNAVKNVKLFAVIYQIHLKKEWGKGKRS